ncbi:MAG: MYXO-CTERM sorting domain-containing protein [Minicystis sp.]
MKGLGDLPGGPFSSEALATNGDGSVVVGRSVVDLDENEEAFYWTETGGMQRLADVASAAGVDLGGAILRQATGVSADGLVVVGIAEMPKGPAGFRLDLTASTSGSTTVASSSSTSGTGGNASGTGGSTSAGTGGAGMGGAPGASTSSAGTGGASTSSAGTGGAEPVASGGCGCRTASAPSSHGGLWLLAIAALTAARRRRHA